MDFTKITYGNIDIYKVKLEDIDDSKLLTEIYPTKRYLFHDLEYNDKKLRFPGIQINSDFLMEDEITIIRKKGYDLCKEIYEIENSKKKVYSGLQTSWIYISTPSNPVSQYHDHIIFSPKEISLQTHYTWIYYIQVPDNCKDKEGHIFFKPIHLKHNNNDEGAFSFFPEQGCLYMWDSEIPHRPEISPNSTIDRVVFAANVNFNTSIK